MMVQRILTNRVGDMCVQLFDTRTNDAQDRYSLRSRNLRIAWEPTKQRVGGKCSLVMAIKTWNTLNLTTEMIPKTAKSRKGLLTSKILESYGMSHKP